MKKLVILFLLISTTLSSEVQNIDYPIKIEIKDGMKHIINPKQPRDGNSKLKLVNELIIGDDEEGDALIYRPFDVQADDEGNIYILDRKLYCIKKFDKNGKFLGQIGRKGKGPGEFMYGYFSLHPNTRIYLLDSQEKRVTIFSKAGKVLKIFRYHLNGSCRDLKSDSVNRLYTMMVAHLNPEDIKKGMFKTYQLENHLYCYNTKKSTWEQLTLIEGESILLKRDAIGTMGGTLYSLIWNLDPGGKIVVGINQTYILSVYSLSGELKFKFGRQFTPQKNKRYKGKTFQKKYFPAFGHKIIFDQEGSTWVEQYRRDHKKEVTYDVFSKEGVYIKKVISHIRIYQFKNNKIYGIFRSKDDERMVVRSRIISGLD